MHNYFNIVRIASSFHIAIPAWMQVIRATREQLPRHGAISGSELKSADCFVSNNNNVFSHTSKAKTIQQVTVAASIFAYLPFAAE